MDVLHHWSAKQNRFVHKIKADFKHLLLWLSFGTAIFSASGSYTLTKYRIITLYTQYLENRAS